MPPVVLPAFCADRERPRLTCVLPSSQPASDSNRESRSRACRTSATECNAGRPRCECSSLPSFPSFVLLPGPSKKQRTGDKDAITAAAASAAAAVAQAVIQPKDQQMQQLQQQLKEKDEEIQKLSPFPLSFPSFPLFSPFLLSFPSLLSLSPSFPSLLLLSFPSLPLLARAMGQLGCQLATGIAANGGKGGGKGGLLWAMWVWVGLGAIQAPHKKRRAATSGKRDRGTAAAQAGSWLKKWWRKN